jgi:hypothetical protein
MCMRTHSPIPILAPHSPIRAAHCPILSAHTALHTHWPILVREILRFLFPVHCTVSVLLFKKKMTYLLQQNHLGKQSSIGMYQEPPTAGRVRTPARLTNLPYRASPAL